MLFDSSSPCLQISSAKQLNFRWRHLGDSTLLLPRASYFEPCSLKDLTVQCVGIKGHAVAEAVAEAPKGVARALLYIVRASPSFLHNPPSKTSYHTFHHSEPQIISTKDYYRLRARLRRRRQISLMSGSSFALVTPEQARLFSEYRESAGLEQHNQEDINLLKVMVTISDPSATGESPQFKPLVLYPPSPLPGKLSFIPTSATTTQSEPETLVTPYLSVSQRRWFTRFCCGKSVFAYSLA